MNSRILAFLQLVLFSFSGCADSIGEHQLHEAENERALSQRESIDGLLRDQMKLLDTRLSKQEFCLTNKSSLLDFLIGKEVASYPQLAGSGDAVTAQFLLHVVQSEKIREWMTQTGSENEYLAFQTDIWDFRTQDVEFSDTLILAIRDGKIAAYRFFAQTPY